MRQASTAEAELHPWKSGELCGCEGDSIASTAIGWIFHMPPTSKRLGAAFAHDAWLQSSGAQSAEACKGSRLRREGHARYAHLRMKLRTSPHEVPGFAFNCKHTNWSTMLADQHAFVVASAAATQEGRPTVLEALKASSLPGGPPVYRHGCGFGSHNLYNQVHARGRLDDISAIFYVNDSIGYTGDLRIPGGNASAAALHALRDELREEALFAALRSYRAALFARRLHPHLRQLPIVQFRLAADCYGSDLAAKRIAADASRPRDPNKFFLQPPPLMHADEVIRRAKRPRPRPLRVQTVPCGTPFVCSCAGRRDKVVDRHSCHAEELLVVG